MSSKTEPQDESVFKWPFLLSQGFSADEAHICRKLYADALETVSRYCLFSKIGRPNSYFQWYEHLFFSRRISSFEALSAYWTTYCLILFLNAKRMDEFQLSLGHYCYERSSYRSSKPFCSISPDQRANFEKWRAFCFRSCLFIEAYYNLY